MLTDSPNCEQHNEENQENPTETNTSTVDDPKLREFHKKLFIVNIAVQNPAGLDVNEEHFVMENLMFYTGDGYEAVEDEDEMDEDHTIEENIDGQNSNAISSRVRSDPEDTRVGNASDEILGSCSTVTESATEDMQNNCVGNNVVMQSIVNRLSDVDVNRDTVRDNGS